MPIVARYLTQNDYPAYDAFLEPHTAEAYFLRSNAARAGLDWRGDDFQAEYIGVFNGADLVAVMGYTWINTVIACAPNPAHLSSAIPLLRDLMARRGGALKAIAAMKPEADFIISALQIPDDAFCKDEDEGFYVAHFDALTIPEMPSHLHVRLAVPADRETLIPWRIVFNIEQLGATAGANLEAEVTREIDRRTMGRELYVLENKDTGALLSFHGMMGSIQTHQHIGPVFTVHDHRGKGYARFLMTECFQLAKGSHLPDLQTIGLFTANPSAVKTYSSIGFRRVNEFRLALCHDDFRYS